MKNMEPSPSLPDYVKPGLDILFVGINPGSRSARIGHHYAGHSNRFWKLLNEVKLVPVVVTYHDDSLLLKWGIGFTNMVSRTTSGSSNLGKLDYISGRAQLAEKVRRYHPLILALLGVTLHPIVFSTPSKVGGRQRSKRSSPLLGLLPERFEGANVVLLPNPSGRNAHYSYQDMLSAFSTLKEVRSNILGSEQSFL